MEIKNENQMSKTQEGKKSKKPKMKKMIITLVAIIAAGAAGSYFLPGNLNLWNKFNIISGGNAAAIVNGEKITKSDVESRISAAKSFFESKGMNLSDEKVFKDVEKQVLNDIVTETLILQDAKKKGINASNDDVEATFKEFLTQFKDKSELDNELSSRNLTEDNLKESIANQMVINKYLQQNTNAANVVATSEEVNDLYDKYSKTQENMPKLQEIKVQLENEVKQQKIRAMVLEIVEKLKKEAALKIFI